MKKVFGIGILGAVGLVIAAVIRLGIKGDWEYLVLTLVSTSLVIYLIIIGIHWVKK